MADTIKAQNPRARKMCSVGGCSSRFDAKGFCKLHYARWRRHGDPLSGRSKEGDALAFLEVARDYEGDECLIWPFAKTKGYACIRLDRKTQYVSRIICEGSHGAQPPGAECLHGCGRGHEGCITKKHLRWDSHAENMRDMSNHGRSSAGRKFGPQSPSVIAKRAAALRGHAVSESTRQKIGHKARLRHAAKIAMGAQPKFQQP